MNCGIVANGCGGTVTCGVDGGTCPTGELCGGGGSPNVCGAKNILPDGGIVDGGLNVCTPIPQSTACAGIGCGQTGDGCGNLYTCGTCTAPESCGGGGVSVPVRAGRLHAAHDLPRGHPVRHCRQRVRRDDQLRHLHGPCDVRWRRDALPVR